MKTTMTEAQIEHMTQRFLGWRLPENFNPDGGIKFTATFNQFAPGGPSKHEPTGTNLFDGGQAKAMIRHMIDGLPLQLPPAAEDVVAKACDALLDDFVKRAEPRLRSAAESLYEKLLYMVQDHLKHNAHWNLANDIERCNRIERESAALREALDSAGQSIRYLLMRYDQKEDDVKALLEGVEALLTEWCDRTLGGAALSIRVDHVAIADALITGDRTASLLDRLANALATPIGA